jgi:hypothetical protein
MLFATLNTSEAKNNRGHWLVIGMLPLTCCYDGGKAGEEDTQGVGQLHPLMRKTSAKGENDEVQPDQGYNYS